MSSELIVALAAVVLSLLFEYLPGLKDWYDKVKDNYQRLIMLVLMVVVSGAVYGINCAGWWAGWIPVVECNANGIQELVKLLLIAVATNQSTFLISPKS